MTGRYCIHRSPRPHNSSQQSRAAQRDRPFCRRRAMYAVMGVTGKVGGAGRGRTGPVGRAHSCGHARSGKESQSGLRKAAKSPWRKLRTQRLSRRRFGMSKACSSCCLAASIPNPGFPKRGPPLSPSWPAWSKRAHRKSSVCPQSVPMPGNRISSINWACWSGRCSHCPYRSLSCVRPGSWTTRRLMWQRFAARDSSPASCNRSTNNIQWWLPEMSAWLPPSCSVRRGAAIV